MNTLSKNEDYIFEIIHDIKAPLASVDFALKDMERDEFLDEIYKINKHNLNYVNSMLSSYAFSKGKYCPKFEVVNLVKIVKEEIRVLNFLIEKKNLRVILSIDKLDDAYTVTDKYLARQIILNLLTNAVKYTPPSHHITISFENKGRYLSVCFSNPCDKSLTNVCSTKMGLNIVKKKLQVLKGKLKITEKDGEICFNTYFSTL